MLIYKHTNKINSKSYIGKTVKTMEARFSEHIKSSENGSETAFHLALKKYGPENFSSTILENKITESIINDRETFWIEEENTYANTGHGYNMTKGGDGGDLITNHPREKEIRALIGKQLTGKNNGMYGKSPSKEHREKISIALKGKKKQSYKNRISSLNIEIYDYNNTLLISCKGTKDFKKYCDDNNMPFIALSNSYKSQGKQIYQTNSNKSKANNKGFFKYIGWYALKV